MSVNNSMEPCSTSVGTSSTGSTGIDDDTSPRCHIEDQEDEDEDDTDASSHIARNDNNDNESTTRNWYYERYQNALEALRQISSWSTSSATTTATTGSSSTTTMMMMTSVIFTIATTMIVWYERHLQRRLTAPPIVYGQINPDPNYYQYYHHHHHHHSNSNSTPTTHPSNTTNTTTTAIDHQQPQKQQQQQQQYYHTIHPFSYITISDVYQHMLLQQRGYRNNIIQRDIQPSLFVGTRAYVSSTMAYLIQQYHPFDKSMFIRSILSPPPLLPTIRIRQILGLETPITTNGTLQPQSQSQQQQYHYNKYHYDPTHHTIQFREIMKMPSDGATIAIDWKFYYNNKNDNNNKNHPSDNNNNNNNQMTIDEWIHQILHGPIPLPVVLILHGINNHTNFGYIQSMMNICCTKGPYIAAGMNFRGCAMTTNSSSSSSSSSYIVSSLDEHDENDGSPSDTPIFLDSTTPRTYNGAYTGDLRTVVQKISQRLLVILPPQSSKKEQHGPKQSKYQPLFLVGNSLGANLLTKYLGEEGRCGTLHPCIAGGVTMGNPLHIDSRNASPIISPLIALGAKRGLYQIYPTMKAMVRSSSYFRQCMKNGWRAITLADYDNAMAPIFCRNEPSYPFQYQIGYHNNNNSSATTDPKKDAAADYWVDASSYRQVPHISVPFLQLIARDDFLTYRSFRDHMYYNMINPYVMVMETTCGGHLGWHEAVVVLDNDENTTSGTRSPRSWTKKLLGTSWADVAMIDFIQAILELHDERQLGCHSNDMQTGSSEFNRHNDTSSLSDNDRGIPNILSVRSRL